MSNEKTTKRFDLYVIVAIGLLAALVFAASFLRILIPTPLGNTALHLGNVLCLLSGLLLGGVNGGLAAGFGSFFFDLIYPGYAADAPYTLIFKFCLALVCGLIAYAGGRKGTKTGFNILGAVSGSLTYVVLYLGKNFLFDIWFAKTEVATAWTDVVAKGIVSVTNAVIACVVAVPLALVIRKAVERTSIYKRVMK